MADENKDRPSAAFQLFESLDDFLQAVAHLDFSHGLLSIVRWSRSAGSWDYVYWTSLAALDAYCRAIPDETNFIVFRARPNLVAVPPGPHRTQQIHGLIGNGAETSRDWLLIEPTGERLDLGLHQLPFHLSGQYAYEFDEAKDGVPEIPLYFGCPAPRWDVDESLEIYKGNSRGAY